MSLITPFDIQAVTEKINTASKADSLSRDAAALGMDESAEQDEKIWKVACGFEEIFINMMLKQMRKTTINSELMGTDNASRLYREMFDAEVAGISAKSRQVGFSGVIHDYLSDQLNGGQLQAQNKDSNQSNQGAKEAALQYEKVAKTTQ